MLQLNNIWFGFDDEFLLEDVSCVIHKGHKVGVVGRNGIGKTTLFKLIQRAYIAEEGEVIVPANWRVAWLRQDVPTTHRTALQFVMDGHKELRAVERRLQAAADRDDMLEYAQLHDTFDALGGFQAEAQAGMILSGLGFDKDDFHKPYEDFSGGWRIRLNLAQTLSQPSELMLLDEPTNHLDLEATVWLQNWMRRYDGALLCISHDREFLDRCVTGIFHLERRTGTMYRGDYTTFETQRAARLAHQGKAYEQQERERVRIQRFIDRFRTYAKMAKRVQSRIKMLERMELVAPLRELSPYSFTIDAPRAMDRPMLSIDEAALGYGELEVLTNITERIYPGDRIALLGLNGAGKSTFLKTIAGELELLAGTRECGMHTTIGYFAQHQLELLDANMSAYDHVVKEEDWAQRQVRNFLGFWGFHGDDIFRPVSSFSGGEKARLVLALIAREKPALLILDEPTNHLDLEMREALSAALNRYDGAVLLVAHDQHLLRECADEFWLVRDGAITHFAGDLDDYEELVARAVQVERQASRSSLPSRKDQRRERALERENRREMDQKRRAVEADIERLQSKLSELAATLADSSTMQSIDNRELQNAFRRHGRMKKELEKLEDEWLALASDD
ncbi:MAG: ATP-binding cassette domain-containing protein [Gammaproteobacteria bacterium]|nr:ATP-binding cassette domain-containing protein [Gammaproteobacteria bacterium]